MSFRSLLADEFAAGFALVGIEALGAGGTIASGPIPTDGHGYLRQIEKTTFPTMSSLDTTA